MIHKRFWIVMLIVAWNTNSFLKILTVVNFWLFLKTRSLLIVYGNWYFFLVPFGKLTVKVKGGVCKRERRRFCFVWTRCYWRCTNIAQFFRHSARLKPIKCLIIYFFLMSAKRPLYLLIYCVINIKHFNNNFWAIYQNTTHVFIYQIYNVYTYRNA